MNYILESSDKGFKATLKVFQQEIKNYLEPNEKSQYLRKEIQIIKRK